MTIDQLIFIGFNGYAAALDRDTGEIVWSNSNLKSGYVSLMLDGDRLIVSTNGYMFCLDPLTGEILWNNEMKGYGTGPTSIVSVRGQSNNEMALFGAASDAAAAATAGGAAAHGS